MMSSTGLPNAGPPVLVPDHVSADSLPDHETVEILYRLRERDRIIGIFGGCVRLPEAGREKRQVPAFTSEVAWAVCFIAALARGSDHVVYGRTRMIAALIFQEEANVAARFEGLDVRKDVQRDLQLRTVGEPSRLVSWRLWQQGWRARRVTCEDSS